MREVWEEAGLRPSGPLALVGIVPMEIYGREALMVGYACDVADGEVKLSHEHSAARWIRPERFRAESFSEENVRAIEARNARVGRIVRGLQQDLDRYLHWLECQRAVRGC